MTRKSIHARVLSVLLLVASVPVSMSARADLPPTADTLNLTPPPGPSAGAMSAPGSTEPVEVLSCPHPSRVAAFIFGGVAIVGVGVGTAFGILALDTQSNYRAQPNSVALGTANQDSIVADVAFGAAVIAGVTSVVLFLKTDDAPAATPLAPPKPQSGVSFVVTPIVGAHTAGAGALFRF
jgi:hypothetical protein